MDASRWQGPIRCSGRTRLQFYIRPRSCRTECRSKCTLTGIQPIRASFGETARFSALAACSGLAGSLRSDNVRHHDFVVPCRNLFGVTGSLLVVGDLRSHLFR